MKKRMHQIELFMKYPHEVQREGLIKLIKAASDTEWGKKYKYNEIDSAKKFAERIPLQDYDSLKPFIDKMRKGEQNVLWNSEIKWFAKSSGTTSDKSKFIPISPRIFGRMPLQRWKRYAKYLLQQFPGGTTFYRKVAYTCW
jgi:hypothetical protein